MIKNMNNEIRGVLLDVRDRQSGSFTNEDGKIVEYDAGVFCDFRPLGKTKGNIESYRVVPAYEQKIKLATENIHEGCLIDLKLEERQVVGVTIIADVLADYLAYDV